MGTAAGRLLAAIVTASTLLATTCSPDIDRRRPSPMLLMSNQWVEPHDRTNLGLEPSTDEGALRVVQEAADEHDLVMLVPSRTLGVDMPWAHEEEAVYEVHLLEWEGSAAADPGLTVAYAGHVFGQYDEDGRLWHYPELWHRRANDSLWPSRRDLSEECLAGEQLEIRGNDGCRVEYEGEDLRGPFLFWNYEWLEDGQHHLLHLSWASAEAFSLDEVLAWLDSLVEVTPSG